MEIEIDRNPAFPCNSPDGNETYSGMELRDYFAGKVIEGLIFSYESGDAKDEIPVHIVAERAYAMADAMLKERLRPQEKEIIGGGAKMPILKANKSLNS
jgi:hypothetical protein